MSNPAPQKRRINIAAKTASVTSQPAIKRLRARELPLASAAIRSMDAQSRARTRACWRGSRSSPAVRRPLQIHSTARPLMAVVQL